MRGNHSRCFGGAGEAHIFTRPAQFALAERLGDVVVASQQPEGHPAGIRKVG